MDVLKKDDGRRSIKAFSINYTLTCEDASTETWSTSVFFFGAAGNRVSTDGSFSLESDDGFEFSMLEGDIGFRHAEGTLLINAARLTDDHQDTQLCTTGPLTWTAERKGSSLPRLMATNVADGTGFMKIRVIDGVAEVVKRIEP